MSVGERSYLPFPSSLAPIMAWRRTIVGLLSLIGTNFSEMLTDSEENAFEDVVCKTGRRPFHIGLDMLTHWRDDVVYDAWVRHSASVS